MFCYLVIHIDDGKLVTLVSFNSLGLSFCALCVLCLDIILILTKFDKTSSVYFAQTGFLICVCVCVCVCPSKNNSPHLVIIMVNCKHTYKPVKYSKKYTDKHSCSKKYTNDHSSKSDTACSCSTYFCDHSSCQCYFACSICHKFNIFIA